MTFSRCGNESNTFQLSPLIRTRVIGPDIIKPLYSVGSTKSVKKKVSINKITEATLNRGIGGWGGETYR